MVAPPILRQVRGRESTLWGRLLPHLLGGAHALVFVAWAAWSVHPFLKAGAFEGAYAAVPGWPWTLVLTDLGVPMSSLVVAGSWLANAAFFYWYGTLWARWLRNLTSR